MATVHAAARDGDLTELAAHLRADAGCVRHRDEFGRTPLHWACLRGHRGIVEWLLECGADPNARDRGGYTPYGLATHGAQLDDRLAADKRAAAAGSWPYPQVWRWPLGRVLRGALFSVFLFVCLIGLALVRPGCAGRNWNTVEVVAEPRLISGDYAHKPVKAMAGSGKTLAVLTEEGDVYLLDTESRLSRTLCRGVIDLASDDTGTIWLLRGDGGIDRAFPLAVGGFSVSAWQPPASRYWKTQEFAAADVLATDIDEDGWLVAVPGGVARYGMNPDGSRRQRSWRTGELSAFATKYAAVVPSGVWLTGTGGGVRFADRKTLDGVPGRKLTCPEVKTFNAGATDAWATAVDAEGKLWLHPASETGWRGPLFAPKGTPGPPPADQLSAAVVHAGQLVVGSKESGLFAYDRTHRQFRRLDTQPVDRLLPAADGLLALGRGLKHFPVTATDETEVRVIDDADVPTADVSPAGRLCVYERTGRGERGAVMAVGPVGNGTPFVLAPNDGWGRAAGRPVVRTTFEFGSEQLVVTDLGAFKYDVSQRTYTDHSAAAEGFLRFRDIHRNGGEIVGVNDAGQVFRTTPTAPAGQPWIRVELGKFLAERAVICGVTVAATGTEENTRGLIVKAGEAKRILGATRQHELLSTFPNTIPVADLHTPADGTHRLTLVGEAADGSLPVFSYTSAGSATTLANVPWTGSRPPKQVRWHPTAGIHLLRADGSVSDAAGRPMFGIGTSPLRPTDATALAPTPTGVLIGGVGGRVAEYDWQRGGWIPRPVVPGEEPVDDLGLLAGTAFARTAAGVWVNMPGLPWQRIPDAVRWLTWMDLQNARGWLIGPTGTRATTDRLDPVAKPDLATARGVAAFLARARHVWRPDPKAGDWYAVTDSGAIGRYAAATDTWSERQLDGTKAVTAALPGVAEGVVLKTDAGLIHLTKTLQRTVLARDLSASGDTVASANGEIVAAAAEPRRGELHARGWRTEKGEWGTSFAASRAADPKGPADLSVVAAAPSASGVFLLAADGRVTVYDPDDGTWTAVYSPAEGEELVGWFDAVPLRIVTQIDGRYRLRAFPPDSASVVQFESNRPLAEWPAGLRAALPPVAPPADNWFRRRARALDPDHGQPGGFALAGGLLNAARAWHVAALIPPPKLCTAGPFPWTRGNGVEVRRDPAGVVEFRLTDGKNTRPLTRLPDGGFAEDRFVRLGVGAAGDLWGFQDEPRQLIRLAVRDRGQNIDAGLGRDLTVPPIPLPDHLDPTAAPDGRLEFRDRFRPGVYWSVVNNSLIAQPGRHAPPLPTIPVGDAALVFERVGFDGVTDHLAAHLEVNGMRRSAWHGADRPAWAVATDAAFAGKLVLTATPAGLVARDRGTFETRRVIATDSQVSFIRDGTGEVVRIDIGGDSFEWIDGPQPLKQVPREAVSRGVSTGPWEWRVRYLSSDARRVEGIQDAAGRKRVEVSTPGLFGGPRWSFADDRVNWIGKPADGANLLLATDDGVWPITFDGPTFVGRGNVLLPGERVERLRCPVGPAWGKFDGVKWTAVQSVTLAPLPGAAVPPAEATLPKHPAWAGTLVDGALALVSTDAADRPGFELGQPYFDRLDGLASIGGKLFTLAFGRAVVERDPANPATVVALRPLPPELPVGWPHQLEPTNEELHLSAKKPDSDEWRRWRFDPIGGEWTAIPAADVSAARVLADTGPYRWRAREPGGPLVPALNPTAAGAGAWKADALPETWWWLEDRFAWDVVNGSAALDDSTALLVTAAGPMTVAIGNGRGTVERVWPGSGYARTEAARLPDGRKLGVMVGKDGGNPFDKEFKPGAAFFESATRRPADSPAGAARREPVVTVGRMAGGIDFAVRWEEKPMGRLFSGLLAEGLPTERLLRDGQFAFDAAATACPLPGAADRWATVTPDGLVCVFDVPGAGKPVVLRSITESRLENATAMRAATDAGVYLLVVPEPGAGLRGDRPPQWVPLTAGAVPPAGNNDLQQFRAGSRVTVDPARLLWTRTDRFLTDGQLPVPRHETGREPFANTIDGMAVAADIADGIAVIRRPGGLEVSVLTRGGLLQTTAGEADGDAALSFPNVKSIAVSSAGRGRVRYGPTGEAWVRSADGVVGKVIRDEWRAGIGDWLDDPWLVAGRRVRFPAAGGVTVNGVTVTSSNNSWRLFRQRPLGPVIDAYPRGDVMWVATRENGVFKVHPDRLVPE